MSPRSTSGAGEGSYDSGANDITIKTLDFDTTTQEYAHFAVAMPESWNEGTVTFIPSWTNTGGASTQNVVWSLAGRAQRRRCRERTFGGANLATTPGWRRATFTSGRPQARSLSIRRRKRSRRV
jgi:hypothetical protein